ncbi:hypothetical protein OG900_33370 [Streptomyces sp. NBC_00433]
MGHTVTAVRDDGAQWTVEYFDDEDTERVRGFGVAFSREAVANRMGAYEFDDPREALLSLIHEFHWGVIKPDPRDDPALVQGWVTTTEPDSERVHLYTARSGADAAGAHRTRLDACAAVVQLRDPSGLLPDHTPDPARVQHHRELTDIYRWESVYGDLPIPPRRHRPGIPLEAPSA